MLKFNLLRYEMKIESSTKETICHEGLDIYRWIGFTAFYIIQKYF